MPVIWVGYELNGRRYIDKLSTSQDTRLTMQALAKYWQELQPRWRRQAKAWCFCQRVIVSVGITQAISPWTIATRIYPHETQFSSLERNELLTRGFQNPGTLLDESDFIARESAFHVVQKLDHPIPGKRHVLVIGTETDTKRMAIVLALTSLLAAILGFVVGLKSNIVANGVGVGSAMGGIVAAVFGYLYWTHG